MPWFLFIWSDELEEHLADHGVTPAEFQEIVCDPDRVEPGRTSGNPIAFGYTSGGRFLACVYELIDESTVVPVTAFEPDDWE